MKKLILECKGCGYTWYPDKQKWESAPNAQEPDCPNEECPNYGTGFHPPQSSIWLTQGIVNTET